MTGQDGGATPAGSEAGRGDHTGQDSFLEAAMLEPREVKALPGGDPVSSLRLKLERPHCRLLLLSFFWALGSAPGSGVCFSGLRPSAGCLFGFTIF